MKKLVMISKESVFSGYVRCGMAELVDSLANSLSSDYEVTLIVLNGGSRMPQITGLLKEIEPGVKFIRFSKVDYYIIDKKKWGIKPIEIINNLQAEIFHNLDMPNLIKKLTYKPQKTIFTFDSIELANKYADVLAQYDCVNTNSMAMAGSIMRQRGGNLSMALSATNFTGVAPGVLTEFFSPEKGLLIPAAYDSNNLDGKFACKQRLIDSYGLNPDAPIYLTMCRLIKEKGLDSIIEQIPYIKETGGTLIVVGKGDPYYEEQFSKYKFEDGLIYVANWASYLQMPPFLAGADFYLQPSLMESGGIMPLTAMSYGTIPIVTLNGGLLDNFNEDNAIIVDDSGLQNAIDKATNLYANKQAFEEKRIYCMQQDISWDTRKENYIALYES